MNFDNHNHYFGVTATNVSKDVLIKFNGSTYEPQKDNDTIFIESRIEGGMTYEFNLYAGYDTDCSEEFLYTKKLKIPRYNIFSEKDECIEYEEFKLCNKWYQGVITEDQFNLELEEYINSLKKEEPVEEIKEEKSLFNKIIDFYLDNILIALPITIMIILLILYKIIITIVRRKRRIKLDS